MVVKVDKVPFEEALSMTGFGKYNAISFGVCSLIIVAMAFEIFSVSYLVPASACELATSSRQQGLMAAMPLMGVILTSHVWGYLADTRGRRKVLILSMSIAFVSGSLAALSPNWIVLSLLKFASSAAVSGALALSLTLLSEYTPHERRSGMILLTTSVFLASVGLMAVITIPILPLKFSYYVPVLDIFLNSWRLLDVLFALSTLSAAVGVYFSYESPKFLLSVGKHEEALKVLQGIYSFNSGKGPDFYRARSVVLDEEGSSRAGAGLWRSLKAQTLPMLRPPLLKDTLLLASLSVIVYISINPFQVWIPFIMNAFMVSVERGSTDLTLCEMIRRSMNDSAALEAAEPCSMNPTAMLMVFGMSAVIAVLNLLTSGVVGRIGRKNLFIAIQVIGGTAALCINVSSRWALSALCYVLFACGIINFGTLTSLNVDLFPTHVKAMAICLTLMAGRGSAVFGINLLKHLLDVDCEAAFYLFGGISLGGGLVGLLLPSDGALRRRKDQLKEQFVDKQELTRI